MRIGPYQLDVENPARLLLVAGVVIGVAFFAFTTIKGDPAPTAAELAAEPVVRVHPAKQLWDQSKLSEFKRFVRRPISERAFIDNYTSTGNQPVVFDAYINQEEKTQSPFFYEAGGITYVPAQLIPEQSDALTRVLQGDEETPTIMLAFPSSEAPSESFVRVYGQLYWRISFIKPEFDRVKEQTQGSGQSDAPVIAVYGYESRTESELRAPATNVAYPSFTYRRGDLQFTLQRVEVTAGFETRMFFVLRNLSNRPQAGWQGPESARLKVDGSTGTPQTPTDQAVIDDTGEAGNVVSSGDLLSSSELQPGEERKGYITFKGGQVSKDQTLSLPDIVSEGIEGQTEEVAETDSIIVRIRAKSFRGVEKFPGFGR